MRIFISSTFVDLREERDAAAEPLRRSQLVPWGMELFVSEHPLLAYMTIVTFRWLRGSDLAQYRKVGIEAATHKNRLLALGAADSIASGPNLNAPLVEDVAILELLAQHPDAAVRRLTFTGIRRL